MFDNVTTALEMLDSDISGAECHGILCGLLCNPPGFQADAWLSHVTGREDLSPFEIDTEHHPLWQMLRETASALESEELEFDLALPADEEPLPTRTRALGEWCAGFVSGVGLCGLKDIAVLSTEAREFIEDLQKIMLVDSVSAAGELDESALVELCEYVRIGAVLVADELPQLMEEAKGETIH